MRVVPVAKIGSGQNPTEQPTNWTGSVQVYELQGSAARLSRPSETCLPAISANQPGRPLRCQGLGVRPTGLASLRLTSLELRLDYVMGKTISISRSNPMSKTKTPVRQRTGSIMVELSPQCREKLEAIVSHDTDRSGVKFNISDVIRRLISDEFERIDDE